MEKTRDQIDEKYKWKVEDIYASPALWEEDYERAVKKVEEISHKQDTFCNSAKDLLQFLKFDDEVSVLIEKLYTYAHLNHDVNLDDGMFASLYEKALKLYHDYMSSTSYVTPALLKLGQETLTNFMEEEAGLEEYQVVLDQVFRYQDHTLKEGEEFLLSKFSHALSTPEEVATVLMDNDINFGTIKNEKGEEVALTNTSYSTYIMSQDRRVRKEAFTKLYDSYKMFSNTFAMTLKGIVTTMSTEASVRHYKSALAMALYHDDVAEGVYTNLIDTVKKHLSVFWDYFQFKKEYLKLDEFHFYDLYTPMTPESNKQYTFIEARDIILEVVKVFGDEYVEIAKRAFQERWMDVYPNKGKVSGAYSGGSYATKPYMLLNYEGKLNDVSTVIHELGHSIHSYYTRKYNPPVTGSYPIFVAEVASTVNELLLNKYLLAHSTDKNERLHILNNMLELFKGTIFRQTMFADFEKQIYEENEKGGVLTKDKLCELYLDINRTYFKDSVVMDPEIQYEWERIPHFYMNFYVYQYATGLSAACHIVTALLEGRPGARENYIAFLKSGRKKYPIETLKIAGVDMNDPRVIESAIQMFQDTLTQLKQELHS